jgi:hypothetical protein
MPMNDETQRLLTRRYKAAVADFNNDKSYKSLQELEALRWEEQLPLVYRLRARALLTGDVIVGCWREIEEEEQEQHRMAAEQSAYTEIGAGVSGNKTSSPEVEDREVETRRRVAGIIVAAPDSLVQRDVVRGSSGGFAGFGNPVGFGRSPGAEPVIELERGDTSPFGSSAVEPTTEPRGDISPHGALWYLRKSSQGAYGRAHPSSQHRTQTSETSRFEVKVMSLERCRARKR